MRGYGILENSDHLFLHHDFYHQIWITVYNWLGLIMVKRSYLSFNLVSTVWVILREWNTRIFQQKEDTINLLINIIKLDSFLWLKANHVNFAFNHHIWWLNPLLCIWGVLFHFVFTPLYVVIVTSSLLLSNTPCAESKVG